jgi:hypothetical protein
LVFAALEEPLPALGTASARHADTIEDRKLAVAFEPVLLDRRTGSVSDAIDTP